MGSDAIRPGARRPRDRPRSGSGRTAPLHGLLWIAGATIALAARPSAAQEPDGGPAIAVDGACPTQQAVETVLGSLLPSAGAVAPSTGTSVADQGASYVVTVGGRAKTYLDADRNCPQRARIAAAFIALVLEPGAAPSEGERTALPAPVIASGPEDRLPPPPRASTSTWVRLDGQGAFEVSSPRGLGSPGLALEVGAGQGTWGAWAACGWIGGVTMALAPPGESVRIERFPCGIGPAARLFAKAVLETDLKVGIALGPVRTAGEGFATTYSSERLEVGARVAIDAALHVSPGAYLLPLVGLEVTYYPLPYHLLAAPSGVVTSTPSVWAGATAGLRWNVL